MTWSEIPGATDTGGKAEPPPKKAGKHRWVALASYTLSDEQVRAGADGSDLVLLDHENRMTTGISCIDCEMPFDMVRDLPCSAEDDWDWRTQEVPDVSDPAPQNSGSPPSGSGGSIMDLDKVILLDSVGVQVVAAGSQDPELILALSLVGRVNRAADVVHHLYFVQPSTIGMLLAQLTSVTPAWGDEVANAYGQRVEELQAEGKWPSNDDG